MKWFTEVPYWLTPVVAWGKTIRWHWKGWTMTMTTWLEQTMGHPQSKQVCEWMAPCPSCHRREAIVKVHDDGMLHQGEDVECGYCGHKGTIEVYSAEEVNTAWEDEHDQA